MRRAWFTRWGWIHRPAGVQGVAVVVFAASFCVRTFIVVDAASHSVSDTLYGVLPYFLATFVVVAWIASKTSGGPPRRG